MAQIFTSQARPDEAGCPWNYVDVDFDAAKRKLVQRPRYAFEKIASLEYALHSNVSILSLTGL